MQTFRTTLATVVLTSLVHAQRSGTPASATLVGTGCATSQSTVLRALGDPPLLGNSLRLQMRDALPSGAAALLFGRERTLPIDLSIFGAPGCRLYVDHVVALAIPADASGSANFRQDLPPDASFDGNLLFSQWVSLDPTANGLGLVLSNAVEQVAGVGAQVTLATLSSTTLSLGDLVTITGVNLPLPADACALVMAPNGDYARLLQDMDNPTRFRVVSVPAGGIPGGTGVLGFMRGDGLRRGVANTPRLVRPRDAWTWEGTDYVQNSSTLTGITVNPPPPAPGACERFPWVIRQVAGVKYLECQINQSNLCSSGVGIYPACTEISSDFHFPVRCPGTAVDTLCDAYTDVSRTISTQTVWSQVALDYSLQIREQMEHQFAGRFTVTGTATGTLEIRSTNACVFVGNPGDKVGELTICCPVTGSNGCGMVRLEPDFRDVALATSTSQEPVTYTVTIPPATRVAKADIYILADTTGSMGSYLAAVRTSAATLVPQLLSQFPDANIAIGDYKDFPRDPYCFRHSQSMTRNDVSLVAAINGWSAGGGNDTAEGHFFALTKLCTDPPATYGWRPDAKRIIVLFGDAPSHDPICTAISTQVTRLITEATVVADLRNAGPGGTKVFMISTTAGTGTGGLNLDPSTRSGDYAASCSIGGMADQATRITTQTGGRHLLSTDPNQLAAAIRTVIGNAANTVNVSLAFPGVSQFVASVAPPSQLVTIPSGGSGVTINFTVAYRNAPCLLPYDHFGAVRVLFDGAVTDGRSDVRIQQTNCPE